MDFEIIVKDRPDPIQKTAGNLRELIFLALPEVAENIYGGKKVQNALYSKEGPKRVVCGIQTNDNFCMLYLHKTDQVDTKNLKLEGKGKHAKHIKFNDPAEMNSATLEGVLQDIYKIS